MQDSRTYVSVSDCSCFFLLPFTFHHHWATFDARLPDICFSLRRLLLSHQMPHSLPVCGWDMNGHYELKEHVVFFSQLSLPCCTVYRAILGSQPCIDALWHSDATWRLWLAIPAIITVLLRVVKYATRYVFEVTRYVIHVTRNLNYVTRFLS